jgi:hypothetical protein
MTGNGPKTSIGLSARATGIEYERQPGNPRGAPRSVVRMGPAPEGRWVAEQGPIAVLVMKNVIGMLVDALLRGS